MFFNMVAFGCGTASVRKGTADLLSVTAKCKLDALRHYQLVNYAQLLL